MRVLREALYRGLTPPPDLTVSQWADEFRMLSPEASSEPGRWRTDRAPHLRAIMDAITDPAIETIVFMKSSQVGGTEVLLNAIGYTIDLDPSPTLVIQPTLEMGQAFSKDRLETMLRDTPVLRQKVSQNRKDASSSILHKSFPGGHVTIAGSNSAAGLASRPIRRVFADEVDRWETSVGDEGDPLALAWKRATTFWNRKQIIVSTPAVKGTSRIEAKYEETDKRLCYVACPHCATRHVLKWANVKWTADHPETAHLVCPECGCEIDEVQRQAMLKDPEWRATAEFHGSAGFHIWECYSPWRRLADIVADFLEAKKSPGTLQVFVNTSLGETWEPAVEQTDTASLIARREPYPAQVPMAVGYLTASVDVQDDRLEALVIGWGSGEESWVIATAVLPGDPQRAEPWQQLDGVLTAGYQHESGAILQIAGTCIDTAGHRTQFAYDYVKRHQHQTIRAIIGRRGEDHAVILNRSPATSQRPQLYTVSVDACKALIYSRLKITEKGAGYLHFPLSHQVGQEYRPGVDEEFLAQLTAEKLVTKHQAGVAKRVWMQTRPRNEALDLMVYNIAALRLAQLPVGELDRLVALLNPSAPPKPPPPVLTPRKPWINRPPRGSWLRGRG